MCALSHISARRLRLSSPQAMLERYTRGADRGRSPEGHLTSQGVWILRGPRRRVLRKQSLRLPGACVLVSVGILCGAHQGQGAVLRGALLLCSICAYVAVLRGALPTGYMGVAWRTWGSQPPRTVAGVLAIPKAPGKDPGGDRLQRLVPPQHHHPRGTEATRVIAEKKRGAPRLY